MSTIPPEYSTVDFGFSAVDEPINTEETLPSAIDENDIMRVILNAIAPLENKLDLLLAAKHEEYDDNVLIAKEQVTQEVSTKLVQVEKLVMPLLVNLLKTADKEYIHWPNRATIVQDIIDQILAITRS